MIEFLTLTVQIMLVVVMWAGLAFLFGMAGFAVARVAFGVLGVSDDEGAAGVGFGVFVLAAIAMALAAMIMGSDSP